MILPVIVGIIIILLAYDFAATVFMIITGTKFQYKEWLSDKNLFGIFYTIIAIIVTLPITIMIYIWNALFFIGQLLYMLNSVELTGQLG